MRDEIKIEGLGVVYLRRPKSFVVINDLISEYGANQENRARLARLSAAILGVCWDHDRNKNHPPIYDAAGADCIRYGGEVLEWLIVRKTVLPDLYSKTLPLFVEIWNLMPKEEEVSEKADYFPEEGNAGPGSAENSKGLGAGA